jgi:hypothetical protein
LDINLQRVAITLFFTLGTAHAGSVDGKLYTNFGNDLVRPIFPVNGKLSIYNNKTDIRPKIILSDKFVAELTGDWQSCVKLAHDGWVRCSVEGQTGWVKRAEFLSGGEYAPVESWPFRWWLYVASDGNGGEESVTMRQAARLNPYLVAPTAFDNIFFNVHFNKEGRAISPRSAKPTGDRVFLVGAAVYLAPENPEKRNGAPWLFLNYYNEELKALCPSTNPESCMSVVNLAPNWLGIKALYEEPPTQFRHKDRERWFGATEVAFARHSDPIAPLMYRVPTNVHMRIDTNPIKDAQIQKNREKMFCIEDCPQ